MIIALDATGKLTLDPRDTPERLILALDQPDLVVQRTTQEDEFQNPLAPRLDLGWRRHFDMDVYGAYFVYRGEDLLEQIQFSADSEGLPLLTLSTYEVLLPLVVVDESAPLSLLRTTDVEPPTDPSPELGKEGPSHMRLAEVLVDLWVTDVPEGSLGLTVRTLRLHYPQWPLPHVKQFVDRVRQEGPQLLEKGVPLGQSQEFIQTLRRAGASYEYRTGT